MSNELQFRLKTLYIATRGVKEYRASIPQFVDKKDFVLEIGCEWGTTTIILAKYCKQVLGTDISLECIQRSKEKYPKLKFNVLDVFNIQAAIKIYKSFPFNKMYIDVSGLSGYRSLLDVISLLEMYAGVFKLELIVIKSGSLKNFAKRCVAFNG